jgi:hypothetical protein
MVLVDPIAADPGGKHSSSERGRSTPSPAFSCLAYACVSGSVVEHRAAL